MSSIEELVGRQTPDMPLHIDVPLTVEDIRDIRKALRSDADMSGLGSWLAMFEHRGLS